MTTTTSYGNFTSNCSDTGSAANLADYVAISLGDYSDDYDIDAIVDDYRDAINEQLEGTGITLNGDEFYGPHPRENVDIAAAIEAVDFYEIAERHDTTNEDEDDAYDAEHGYIAAIATADDTVQGEYTDVTVAEAEVHTYRTDDDGNELPELVMSMNVVTGPVELDVRVDDKYKLARVETSADAKLSELGWTRTGDWKIADNALYATVERA